MSEHISRLDDLRSEALEALKLYRVAKRVDRIFADREVSLPEFLLACIHIRPLTGSELAKLAHHFGFDSDEARLEALEMARMPNVAEMGRGNWKLYPAEGTVQHTGP